MRRIPLVIIGVLVFAMAAKAQGRVSGTVTTAVNTPGVISTVSGAKISFCNYPANAVPCTNYATTSTDLTLATPCPNNQQVVLDGTNTCVTNADAFGNWGVWTATGTYSYTVTLTTGASYGPFSVTLGGGGGGGGSGTVTHTTSALTTGKLVQGNGGADIKPGDLAGDCTTSGSLTLTCGSAIARTGTDINTSNQVTATHLASPLPITQGGTGLIIGTSGGIPCWTASTTMAASAALNVNVLPKGGGVGACPTNSSVSDNGTIVSTTEQVGGASFQAGSLPSGCTTSANGGLCFIEAPSTGFTPTSGTDYIRADSVSHTLKCSQNGAAEVPCVGGAGGGVTSISGDGAFYTNSGSTGAVTLSLGTAGAHKWWGNNTGAPAAPGYQTIGLADLPSNIALQGTDINASNQVTSTHITGGTTNFFSKFNATGNLVPSLCDEGVTTANVMTCTHTAGSKVVSIATGTSPPTCGIGTGTAGISCWGEGTAPTSAFASAVDVAWADATNHCLHANQNNVDLSCYGSWGAANAWTGNETHTGTESFKTLENVQYADQYASLSACLTAAGANGVCVAPSNYSTTVSSQITISTNNTTLRCENGATINIATAITGFSIQGAHDTVTGCNIVGPGAVSNPDGLVIAAGATYATVTYNSFSNFTGASGTPCVISVPNRTASVASPVSFVWVQNNTFTNIKITGVCSYDQADHVFIDHNYVDFSAATVAGNEGIIVHGQDTGTTPTYYHVDHNKVKGGTGNCIEVGAFGGNAPQWVDITDNQCTLTATVASGTGGFSLSNVTDFLFSNNIFNANGFTPQGNQAMECVDCIRGAITGNTANIGSNSAMTIQGIYAVGTNAGSTTDVTVSGNVANISWTGAGNQGCFYSGITTPTNLLRVNYSGNICNLTGSTGKAFGIAVQSNNASATVQNIRIQGNALIGTNVSGDSGIVMEKDAGTMNHNSVGANEVYNFNLSYSSNIASPASGFCASCVDSDQFASNGFSIAGTTSGTTTLLATAAAGATTATLPANTGTIAELNLAQTWTAAQSYNTGDLIPNTVQMPEIAAPSGVAAADVLWADSTAHEVKANLVNGGAALVNVTRPSPINQTGKTAAITTATLCAASAGNCNVAGQYRVEWNFWGSGTACSSVTAGSVTFLLTWTDENAVTHSAVAMQMLAQTGAATMALGGTFPFQTALANESATGSAIISTNGSVIQYATGYTACTTGTGTYNLRASVTRVQ